MKRSPLKQGRRKPLSPEERQQAIDFKAFTWGKSCANCGRPWSLTADAHHCVEAQELRKRDLPVYDRRNALALCSDCHERHTNASSRVPFRKLSAVNVAYAYEVLGPFAGDYLAKKYPVAG